MKNWKPIFIENSSVPRVLSKISPIDIKAIALGIIVFSKEEMDEQTKRHETIHFQQYLETLFIGFLVLYLIDYLRGYVRYKDGSLAYLSIRAEKEAYDNHHDPSYLETRKRYAWLFPRSNNA